MQSESLKNQVPKMSNLSKDEQEYCKTFIEYKSAIQMYKGLIRDERQQISRP